MLRIPVSTWNTDFAKLQTPIELYDNAALPTHDCSLNCFSTLAHVQGSRQNKMLEFKKDKNVLFLNPIKIMDYFRFTEKF